MRQGSEDPGKTNTENRNHSAGKCKLCLRQRGEDHDNYLKD